MADEKFVLSCCSTVDLTQERLASLGIEWVPFHYEIDGVEYDDDLWESRSPESFYKEMANGGETKTSQVNIQQYYSHFKRLFDDGCDILHVSFSSGLSGSVDSARLAAIQINAEYADRKVVVIDSLCASSGYGLLMDAAAQLKADGMGFDELLEWVKENRLRVHHWFFSTDLTYYVKGGRVSKTAGLVGTALKICPLLNMNYEGKLTPREKIRTKKRAMAAALQKMCEHAQGGTGYSGKVFICHSACASDAEKLAAMVEDAFPRMTGRVEIFPIGPAIGSHTGPGTISVFFFGDERMD